MAKIEDSKPKKSSGAFERLLDNKQMANIFVKAQSTVITNGTELEKIISHQAQVIPDLDKFIDDVKDNKKPDGTYLCIKSVVKKSSYKMDHHEPDFIVFVVNRDKICKVVELKDGDAFDTKKSKSEFESLKQFTEFISPKIPFMVEFYICCFNQEDKDKIVAGFKNTFTKEKIMTGKELCALLGIDYNEIIATRKHDALDNFNYVIKEMTNLSEMRQALKKQYSEHISESDFYPQDINEEN